MEPDPNVIRAIETAVDADPSNEALRVHLAGLLIEAGRPQDALAQLETVLRVRPDHLEALALAAKSGAMVGDARSAGWLRLYESLSGSEPGPPALELETNSTAESSHSTSGFAAAESNGEHVGDPDWDAFLEDVLREAGRNGPVTLKDVGGLREVKERLQQSFLAPLSNPELRRLYGANLRGGLLLWGPPGCGKTFLARAVAGEMEAQFLSVGLHQILDMWLGNSEKQLHEMFEYARRHTPCVLFFDEVDAIGHSRTNLNRGAMRNVVAQLLSELDGVDSQNEGIFVIGATNQPWDVDAALRRPGRFDRTMLVLPPDAEARESIIRYHLRDRPTESLTLDAVVRATEGFSGADLQLICQDAAELALAEAIRTSSVRPITESQLLEAQKSVKASCAAWFESARNHVRYANDTGEYDELAAFFKRRHGL